MRVVITFGYSPGAHVDNPGFWIWQQVQGGPASGVGNIAWVKDEPVAEMIVTALTERIGKAPWVCGHCRERHIEQPKVCNYCGTKPETG